MSNAKTKEEPLPKRRKLDSGEDLVEGATSVGTNKGENVCRENPAIIECGGMDCKFLKEGDVGIIEYVSSQAGFFAILKQRLQIRGPKYKN